MWWLCDLWKMLTPTKVLTGSSGALETAFYESVYRVAYIAGITDIDLLS